MSRWLVVTGVAGGIGRALAESARAHDYSVLGIDQSLPPEEVCDDFRQFDLSHWRGLSAELTSCTEDRAVAGLVNNAAVQPIGNIDEISDADIASTLDVNVAAAAVSIRALAGGLARAGGSIVNVSSVHALASTPGMALYAASKAALLALTRGAALDLAPQGVRVNAVVPGAVDSGLLRANFAARGITTKAGMNELAAATPLGRVGLASDVAEAALFLLDSRRSGFMTGQHIVVDGGASLALGSERDPHG